MDAVILSRLQFAITTMFHFIFVPITLGLSLLVAYMETRYVRTGDEMYLRMTKFWGKLFLINFALGIVTGITLEFQFGMNWARYSKYVGDIFGAPLAIEATVAFFLESTFLGFWIFGWNKVSKRVHALSIWLVAIASNLSALWILLANGWMQHPVGYVLRNNRAEMVDFTAVVTNPYGLLKFFHTIFAAYVVASFFVIGVSAYHILKKRHLALFKSSFRMAATFGLISSILVFAVGDFHAKEVAKTQPAKFAA
ncbi:MAG: cytochrome ubiquinol oxidase subunit I, partial [Acidobacteriota bacterium]